MKLGHFPALRWTTSDEGEGAQPIAEVFVGGEGLARGAESVLGTLLHEAAHTLADVRGIKDTSRQGRWHNAKFKALAEELGVEVTKGPRIGWSPTSVTDTTRAGYNGTIRTLHAALCHHRSAEQGTGAGKTKKPSTPPCVCSCGRRIRVAASVLDLGRSCVGSATPTSSTSGATTTIVASLSSGNPSLRLGGGSPPPLARNTAPVRPLAARRLLAFSLLCHAMRLRSLGDDLVSAWERAEKKRLDDLEFQEREDEARERNEELQALIEELNSVLVDGVRDAREADYERRLVAVADPSNLLAPTAAPEPDSRSFEPPSPGVFSRLVPGWEGRHEERRAARQEHYKAARQRWLQENDRAESRYRAEYEQMSRERDVALEHNQRILELASDAAAGKRAAVEDYVLEALFSGHAEHGSVVSVRYVARRAELLIEVTFPSARAIPAESSWVHIKSRKVVESKPRTKADLNAKYRELICQITLSLIYRSLRADRYRHIRAVSFKGKVSGVSQLTGRAICPTVVSLRVDRETFLDRDFTKIDPVKLLKSFRANVSDEPTELKPVPLVVEFEIDDPRVIDEEDILARLDDRDNLMDLTYGEFESIIVNLFTAMGFEARQTVRSKDGGVDCIAVYRDPVGVTTYVIQAKQWSQVVKVDAVRDLYGTMTHERAGKAVLVTTSKVSAGGWKWAEGKSMQIVEGAELLDLFKRWTDRRVTIVFPSKQPKAP